MITANMTLRAIHEGRNLKRIRKMLGVKKHELAVGLGLSCQEISRLEAQKIIDDDLIEKIADTFKSEPETFEEVDEGMIVVYVEALPLKTAAATDEIEKDNSNKQNFDAVAKITELYESLLKSERKQIELLEKLLQEREPARVES